MTIAFFYATINQFICRAEDELAPWWVTLARHEQSRYPVQGAEPYEMLDQKTRENLTALHFVTIDSESTMDMDDALYIEPIAQNSTQTGWKLVVAIADPTAYIALDSQIEQKPNSVASQIIYRALTFQCYPVNYPMNYVP